MARLNVSENSARRIAKAVTTVERSYLSSQNGVPEAPSTNFGSYLVKTPSGGIPARSGTTLGEEDCTIQIIDKSTQGVTDGETLNVLNATDSAIAGNSYIRAVRTKSGDYIAEAGGSTSIPATRVDIHPGTTANFKHEFITTKQKARIDLQGPPVLWNNYWSTSSFGGTSGNVTIVQAGAYIINLPFTLDITSYKTSQVQLDTVGAANVYVYKDDAPEGVTIELWATEEGNTTYPTVADSVLLDRWENNESPIGLAVPNYHAVQRSGVISALFESEVAGFELQIWHYCEENTTASGANAFTGVRQSGWLIKLPNSIDDTFDAGDLGIAEP